MKKHYYYASVFALIQLIAIVRNYTSDYFNFFWFCDFVPALFFLAFLAKDDEAVQGLVNIGLFPQIIYLVLLVYSAFAGLAPPGMSHQIGPWYVASSLVIHLSTLLALFATRKIKPSRKTLIYSLGALCLIYIVTLLKTSPQDSVNYVYQPGTLNLPFLIPDYTFFWIPIVFIICVLPTQLLQRLIYQQSKNKYH